jgi:hypothetical protein
MSINAKAQDGIFRFILRGKNAIQTVTKMVLIRIGERLVFYSAVGDMTYWKKKKIGYSPGLFKNNWQLGMDVSPQGVILQKDPSGGASLLRMRKSIPRWPVGHTYYFVNNLPYARRLEAGGHSPQVPPGGMVARVQLEFPQIVRECEIEYAKTKD